MAPMGAAQSSVKELLDSILDAIGLIFDNHVVVGELLESKSSQHAPMNTPKSIVTKISGNPDSESSKDTKGYTFGAYIFRPNATFPIKSQGHKDFTIVRGLLMDEVHQHLNSWIYQVTRLYKEKEHAEIGPIPVDDGVGKEITTEITTSLKTNKTFYTESNVRDFRTDWTCK
ncbi:hypothetical protein L2E82_46933 [Cichorium intybus]|uniref:Uncharacterized protein n=1 Tax=Cichorium intybus TaxID=13427 RepID=A0ACB8YTC9_CICIN|nr:hypothetical protein L2E82_46933 [Cichorium intybus]